MEKVKPFTQQQLITSLIKDDLINCRLVYGLQTLGVDASNYYLHLSQTIFRIMGFEDNAQTEIIYEQYQTLTQKINNIDFVNATDKLDALALEIYEWLMQHLP